MPLFAGLSHVLIGNQELAQNHLEKTKKNLQGSQYWHSRFTQFDLTSIVTDFPQNTEEVQKALEPLRNRYSEWTG